MPERLPSPGPSFLRELPVRAPRDGTDLVAGIGRPTTGPDDWWLGLLWIADDAGIVSFEELAPAAGPPIEPPLLRLGPAMAGGLSGMIREENGRLAIRLAPVVPPDDASRPWRAPAAIRAAFRWEPARAATMRPAEIATQVLLAFVRAVESLGRS